MKTLIKYLALLCLLASTTAAVSWVNGHWIQWTWANVELTRFHKGAKTIEFGLREDGIVVWRELTTVTNAVSCATNSPQEAITPTDSINLTNAVYFR